MNAGLFSRETTEVYPFPRSPPGFPSPSRGGVRGGGIVTAPGVLGSIQSTAVRPWTHPAPNPSPSRGGEPRRRVGVRGCSMSRAGLLPIRGPEDFASAFDVSRETIARLTTYEGLLRQWQKAVNLVAPSTLDAVWHRHFANSAQLLALAPTARTWVDLGSGAGFPGLVVAILLAIPRHCCASSWRGEGVRPRLSPAPVPRRNPSSGLSRWTHRVGVTGNILDRHPPDAPNELARRPLPFARSAQEGGADSSRLLPPRGGGRCQLWRGTSRIGSEAPASP